jgi:hypothetical protein
MLAYPDTCPKDTGSEGGDCATYSKRRKSYEANKLPKRSGNSQEQCNSNLGRWPPAYGLRSGDVNRKMVALLDQAL